MKFIDTEKTTIIEFIEHISKLTNTDKNKNILDAGAGGKQPYKKYFKHLNYESTDFTYNKNHAFICSLEDIPKPNNSYDYILCTQVLEHISNPQQAINELYRILNKGGLLFLTAPQGWGLHLKPYHYFNFTRYGLKHLFKNTGFSYMIIEERGGMFFYLSKRIKTLTPYILSQYFNKKGLYYKILFYLSLIITLPICFIFYYLDRLDKDKDYTLGYKCILIK